MAVSAPAVETPPVRIVIADDHLIARVGLVTIVNEQHDMTVVAEATNGQQAVALYRKLCPDVILMDLRMPVMDGFDAARAIRAEFPDARILALSTYSADEYIHRAFRAGVQAYLKKDVQHDDLIQAIRAVHSGQAPITASLVAQWPSGLKCPRVGGPKTDRPGTQQQTDWICTQHRGVHGDESREEYSW